MYSSLEVRIIQSYIDLYPPFIPDKKLAVSSELQKEFYNFILKIYNLLQSMPELLYKIIRPDDFFPNRYNKSSYNKPDLKRYIDSDIKKIDDFFYFLFSFSKALDFNGANYKIQSLKIPPKYAQLLSQIGITINSNIVKSAISLNILDALSGVANLDEMNRLRFSRAYFNKSENYLEKSFIRLFSNSSALSDLCSNLTKNGYSAYPMYRDDNKLDYVKNINNNDKIGDPKHGDHSHIGISLEYDPGTEPPYYLILRIQNIKELLNKFDILPTQLKEFIVVHTKKCDGCNYCIQTDKTGKKLKSAIVVSFETKKKNLCPLFPGFSYTFESLSMELSDNISLFLAEMEKISAV